MANMKWTNTKWTSILSCITTTATVVFVQDLNVRNKTGGNKIERPAKNMQGGFINISTFDLQ